MTYWREEASFSGELYNKLATHKPPRLSLSTMIHCLKLSLQYHYYFAPVQTIF